MAVGAGKPVPAAAETPSVGTEKRDAADDPEIWVDPKDPTRGVIIGTDKQAGLYVYDLAGQQLQYLPGGKPNNVDLAPGLLHPRRGSGPGGCVGPRAARGWRGVVPAGPFDAEARLLGRGPDRPGRALWPVPGAKGASFVMIVNGVDGQVRQHLVTAGADGRPQVKEERRFSVPTQPEGCVADDVTGRLYLGEEGAGIWRFDLGTGPARGEIMAAAPSATLKPDVEGLTLLREGASTYLIASSQGDSAFAVWNVEGATPRYRGRFSVVGNGKIDAVTGTDGVAALGGQVGAFPLGLVVVQDDEDQGGAGGRQNFKLVDWAAVKAALGL